MTFLFQPVRNETESGNSPKTKANYEGHCSACPAERMFKHMGPGRSVQHSQAIAALSTSNLWKAPAPHQNLFKKITDTWTFLKMKIKI